MSIISTMSATASETSEPETPGIFAFIMSALHASRRRQASRIMRQCEHLLTNEREQDFGADK
ncbi:hypothetical protein [Bradyrhizobium sp. 930_D9_N1_4]|uniref:hypothetical protein n=1 Tax=Bradyrhizobium sp. 930_D9_N1_4 TaxID=3240374 RepID=UPI003F8AEFCE